MTDLVDRVRGSLLGLAVGDALGAPVEFMTPEAIQSEYGVLREIVGGGVFGWRPGEGTDDSDMTASVLDAYLDGYSLDAVGERFLAWLDGGPRDVGGTTGSALRHLRANGDPTVSGKAVWGEWAAGNGSLMRCLPTGLIRTDLHQLRREAAEISAITHSDPRCVDACVAYCELVALLLDGVEAAQAVETVAGGAGLHPEISAALTEALRGPLGQLNPSTWVPRHVPRCRCRAGPARQLRGHPGKSRQPWRGRRLDRRDRRWPARRPRRRQRHPRAVAGTTRIPRLLQRRRPYHPRPSLRT